MTRLSLRALTRIQGILLVPAILLLLSGATELLGQQSSTQPYDVPVVLTRLDTYTDPTSQRVEPSLKREDLVKDFGPENFQVQVGGVGAPVQGAAVDKGPKRVVLVVDASKPVAKTEWEQEIDVLQILLRYARGNDKFTFVFVGADSATGGFLSLGETRTYLGKLRAARPATTDSEARIYDALLAGANRLDPPQFGDIVVLVGRIVDSGSKTIVADLTKLFLKNRIRFIGLSLSLPPGFPASFDPRTSPPPRYPTPVLAELSGETGYFTWAGSVGWDYEFLYECIAEPYRLTISTPARQDQALLDIKLLPGSKKKKVDGIIFHYPRFIYP